MMRATRLLLLIGGLSLLACSGGSTQARTATEPSASPSSTTTAIPLVGPPGPAGPAGVSGYEQRQDSKTVPIAASTTAVDLSVPCPADKVAIAGGASATIDPPVDEGVLDNGQHPLNAASLMRSEPDGQSGWRATAVRSGGGADLNSLTLTVTVICAVVG